MKHFFNLIVTVVIGLGCSGVMAKDTPYTVSSQFGAFAPNAGGQQAYSLKLARDDWEAGIFSNQYLMAGDLPMTGLTYDWRFPICDETCFWQFYAQTGAGISNGGPVAQISWTALFPLLPPPPIWLPIDTPKYMPMIRVDFTTQFIFIQYRTVSWSYPLWVGIAVSF